MLERRESESLALGGDGAVMGGRAYTRNRKELLQAHRVSGSVDVEGRLG